MRWLCTFSGTETQFSILQMEHDDFTTVFILCLKQLMQTEFNQFTNTGLKFMAEFVSSFQAEDMHPLFDSIFVWVFHVSIRKGVDDTHRI